MTRAFASRCFIALLSGVVFGQSETPPTFDIADVHVSPKSTRPVMNPATLRGDRYQVLNATMVDLIRTAYNVDADKVLSGPSWLEQDRFDVIAKAPPAAKPETLRLMLQAVLADRFKLVVRKDTHPLPAFSLTVGKTGPKLKEADGSVEPGCKFTADTAQRLDAAQAQLAAARAASDNGAGPVAFRLQPTYTYTCGSVTMAEFADAMHTMPLAPSYFGTGIIVDQTGLKGAWDIVFKYTSKPPTANAAAANSNVTVIDIGGGQNIPLFDAVDKQLGLKLDPITYPTPVYIVESVNRKPTGNPPGVVAAVAPPPPATEFEVADLRLSDSKAQPTPSPGYQTSGRVDLRNYPLLTLINVGLNITGIDGPTLAGIPKWLTATVRVDLVAKLPGPAGPPNQSIDLDVFRPAMLALLKERFKLAYHTEQRPSDAYTLVAAKPKLKKAADPLARSNCKDGPGPDGKDPRPSNPVNGRLVTCTNVTMAEFADQLPRFANGYLRSEVLDATGIEGAYDFTINFAANGAAVQGTGGGRGGDPGPVGAAPGTTDPSGAISLWDVLTRQLGLKLELQKRPMPVFVIDHLEEKPSDN